MHQLRQEMNIKRPRKEYLTKREYKLKKADEQFKCDMLTTPDLIDHTIKEESYVEAFPFEKNLDFIYSNEYLGDTRVAIFHTTRSQQYLHFITKTTNMIDKILSIIPVDTYNKMRMDYDKRTDKKVLMFSLVKDITYYSIYIRYTRRNINLYVHTANYISSDLSYICRLLFYYMVDVDVYDIKYIQFEEHKGQIDGDTSRYDLFYAFVFVNNNVHFIKVDRNPELKRMTYKKDDMKDPDYSKKIFGKESNVQENCFLFSHKDYEHIKLIHKYKHMCIPYAKSYISNGNSLYLRRFCFPNDLSDNLYKMVNFGILTTPYQEICMNPSEINNVRDQREFDASALEELIYDKDANLHKRHLDWTRIQYYHLLYKDHGLTMQTAPNCDTRVTPYFNFEELKAFAQKKKERTLTQPTSVNHKPKDENEIVLRCIECEDDRIYYIEIAITSNDGLYKKIFYREYYGSQFEGYIRFLYLYTKIVTKSRTYKNIYINQISLQEKLLIDTEPIYNKPCDDLPDINVYEI